jgi:hypothetical protein
MIARSFILVSLIALSSSTAVAQQLELVPEWTGFKSADLRSPSELDLTFEPLAEVTRFGVRFKDLPEFYNGDQWTMVDPNYSNQPIGDLLVYFYDVPSYATMKQRVREANVVDEEATFPLPLDRCQDEFEAVGSWVIARRMPEHARIGAEEVARPLVIERHPLAYLR